MVAEAIYVDGRVTEPIKDEKEEEDADAVSVSTTSTCEGEEGAVVLSGAEERAPRFQNIEVSNSSDVHFGNKTYYQGPVTIKQILVTNRDDANGETNGSLPPLAIQDKCDSVNGDLNYRTDSVQKTNGYAKTANGMANVTSRGEKWSSSFKKRHFIISASAMVVVLLVVTALVVGLTWKPHSKSTPDSPLFSDEDDSGIEPYEPVLRPGLRLNDRQEWLAALPTETLDPLPTPVPYVIIHHTATENCSTLAECKIQVQQIQKFHMFSQNWSDIGYNFLVGGDGYAYEGRGWTIWGAHARGYNNVSIGIAFIGTFITYLPPPRQLEQAKELIKEGLKLGYIREDYKLLGMNQVSTFESPGRKLFREIKTWPHWSPTP